MCIYGEQTLATTCHNLLSPSQSFIALVPESSGLNGRTLNCRVTLINLMTDWNLIIETGGIRKDHGLTTYLSLNVNLRLRNFHL